MTQYMYIKSCLYRQSPLTTSYITLKPSPFDTQITPLHTKNPISQSQYRLHLYFFTEFRHRYDSRKPIDNVPKILLSFQHFQILSHLLEHTETGMKKRTN